MKLSVFQTIVTAWFLVFLSGPVLAQQQIKPGRNVVRLTWIQPGAYKMIWYAERDTLVIRIGEVIINTLLDKNRLTITTEVLMSGGNDAWIDTTHAHTLQPVFHSSYNANREMHLLFGKVVSGYYYYKSTARKLIVADTLGTSGYFDSNLYPHIIPMLPLQEGYTATLPIYDYNPNGKTGLMNAYIKKVSSGTYEISPGHTIPVWMVTVTDELNPANPSISTYFIAKEDRKLWKQEIISGNRKMSMVRVE